MYRQLSPEQMSALMERLIERDLIPDHLLEEVKEANPDSRVIDAAELLHSLLCTEEHGIDGSDCKYHAESMYPDPRQNPYHRRWITHTQSLLDTYGLSLDQLRGLVREVIELNVIITRVGECYLGEAKLFLLDSIAERLPKLPPVQTAL